MKMNTLNIHLILFLCISLMILISGCGGEVEEGSTELPPVSVVTQNPDIGTITKWHRTTCELNSPLEASLSFSTGGRIIELTVDEGDTVVAGQYLGKVDTTTLAAQYSAILSSVDGAIKTAEAADIAAQAVESQIELAQASADQAEADYERYRNLYEDSVATVSEFEQMELRWESSKISLQGAIDQHEAALSQATAYHANVQSVRDQARQISEMIDDGTLRAPFGGRIASRYSDPGTVAGPGMPVFRLIGEGEDVANRLEVNLSIPESLISKIPAGTSLYLDLASCEREIQVPVDHLGPEVDPESRTVDVVAYVDKDSICLLPGMFGTVRIPIETHENTILVPEDAVLEFEDVDIVYIAQGDIAVLREVELGIREEGTLEILGGIEASDRVIVVGNRFLTDGAKIEIQNEPGAVPVEDQSEMEDEG